MSEIKECQHHNQCAGWCESDEEREHCLCCDCLQAEREEEAEQQHAFEMQNAFQRIACAAGIELSAPGAIADAVCARLANILPSADHSQADSTSKMGEVLAKINGHMHEAACPTFGSIGECAAIDANSNGTWWAALYIWDHEFNDPALVAKWFHEAGAAEVLISHVLHDEANGDRNGLTFDGVRAWHVEFSMPASEVPGQVEPPTIIG